MIIEKMHIIAAIGIIFLTIILFTGIVYYLRCQPVIHVTSGCPNIPSSSNTDTPIGQCLYQCDQYSDTCYTKCSKKDDECIRQCYQDKATCYMKCLGKESFTPASGCSSCRGPV